MYLLIRDRWGGRGKTGLERERGREWGGRNGGVVGRETWRNHARVDSALDGRGDARRKRGWWREGGRQSGAEAGVRLEDFNEEQEQIRSREDRLMERRSARSAQAFSVSLLYWYTGSGVLSLLALLVQKVLRLLATLHSGQSAGRLSCGSSCCMHSLLALLLQKLQLSVVYYLLNYTQVRALGRLPGGSSWCVV
jgi:hypothetical protein